MELKVYNSEKFERGKLWYIAFASVFVIIFLVSIFYKNIVGAILMFFLLGGYLYYGIINNQEIKIKITDDGLIIGDRLSNRKNFTGYSLEIDPEKQNIKNIVFITQKHHNIHTISDSNENMRKFLEQLNKFLPMIGEFPQTFWEKVSRKMKL
ncbi:MAG TPA: hypothetical protein VJ892_02015 [Candidatus Absconditabacterales bacterium]|nr:hypothetical protein [Candidatus Absconditabacterales bacterium]